jgi:transcriptional regulator with XRE-family HTH domain
MSAAKITENGVLCQPLTVSIYNQNRFVRAEDFKPRAVLRQNVDALLKSKRGPTNPTALGKAAGVGQATIDRILSDEGVNARIETLAKIAKVYELEAWQLLVAGMHPSNPPVLLPVSKAERTLYDGLKAAMAEAAKK